MKIDVLLGEGHVAPADVVGRLVIVVDVLRAATTVAVALANGARAVVPFEQVDEVAVRAKQFNRAEVRLAGERRMQRIEGFDLGNSPGEFTRDAVEGRTILYSTSNGTATLVATHGSRACFFAGFVNAGATVSAARAVSRNQLDCTIICSGTDRHAALEDVVCAGLLARGLARGRTELLHGDGSFIARAIAHRYRGNLAGLTNDSMHACALIDAGFDNDVSTCLDIDSVPIAVAYHDRQLVRHDASMTDDAAPRIAPSSRR
jgi:2-phosphosulfolactate phosphatase